jgi:CP family cyanate transporter-like MFS transporter
VARRTVLILLGIVALSVNLRPAAVSVGPVLAEVRAGLDMSTVTTGLLTSLPVLAFAAFGALAPRLAARIGLHRVTLLALACVVVGLAARATAGNEWVFLALSALALAGMAVANVLLPSLVKLHFPDRIGRVTAIYTTALSIGLTASLLLTVPIADAFGTWRWGLGAWAVLAAVAVLPWLGLVAHDRHMEERSHTIGFAEVARTRLGQAMVLLFGLQSIQAYVIFGWFAQLWRDNGYSPGTAGALVALVAGVSIPLSLWLPALMARLDDQRRLLWTVLATYPIGYAALVIAPHTLAVPCALLIGVGTAIFPLVLTLIGLRAHTPAGTAALSGVTQSLGYLLAGLGPFGFGAIHAATGGWTWPLWTLVALCVPMFFLAGYLGCPRYLEDQLERPGSRSRRGAPPQARLAP